MAIRLGRMAALGVLVAAGAAVGQVAPAGVNGVARAAERVVTAEENAALRLWAAWSLLPPDGDGAFDQADFRAVGEADFVLREGQLAALAELGPTLELLVDASMLPRCDFGLEMELGPELVLPHLGAMRRSARLLAMDARARLDAGDAAGAGERLAAVLAMAEHTAHDDVVISSLVSTAIVDLALRVVEHGEALLMADESARTSLAGVLGRFAEEDPMRARRAILAEGRFMTAWTARKIREHGADAPSFLADLGLGEHAAAGAKRVFAEGGVDALLEEVKKLRTYYELIDGVWNDADAVEQLELLGDSVGEDEFGTLAPLLAPALSRYRANIDRAETRLAELRGALGS